VDGVTWDTPYPVVQAGTDGWFPSLAIDPQAHLPHIVYYHCSDSPGVVPGTCPASQQELRISHRDPAGNWTVETVDTAGGYLPKIGFIPSTGKRVVVYRASSADSTIKLALEN
jgi:hypothetical protein